MSDLLKLIQAYLAQANIRGIDPENPIPFHVRSPDGQPNEGKIFVVQVGYTEPTFSQLPYSVLWICYDQQSDMHAKLYRRVSHHPSAITPELNYTWVEITDYSQTFEKEQFYIPVADLDLVDGGDQVDPILVASTEAYGTVVTSESVAEPVAIITTDSRLTDSREPLPHVHDDEPRATLQVYQYEVPLVGEDEEPVIIEGEGLVEVKRAYVKIDSAFPSAYGQILFIKAKDEKHDHVWIGEWRKASLDDIEITGPKVVSAQIVSPSEVFGDNETYDFNWQVTYDDDNVVLMNPTWSVDENVLSIVIDDDGVLDIPNLEEATQITVSARAVYDGREFTDSVDIDIENSFVPVEPQRIEISGPLTVKELLTGKYTVTLFSSDGSSSKVTPDTFTSNNTSAAIIDVTGNLTTYDVDENQAVTLTAEYTVNGTLFSDTFDMTVIVEILDWNLEIRGVAVMDELTSEDFEVYSVDENGTEVLISSPNTFEITGGNAHATLVGGTLTANEVLGNHAVTLTAEHTVDSVTKTVTKQVTVRDVSTYPESIEITFPAEMDENETINLVLNVVYDDGSRTLLGNPSVVKFNKSNVLTYVEPLGITSGSVTAPTSVTITVEHTVDGTKVSGTHNVKVRNSEAEATRLRANQATTYIQEKGTTVGFGLFLVNDDSTETQVLDRENVTITPNTEHDIEITLGDQAGWLFRSIENFVGGNIITTFTVVYEHEGTRLTLEHPVHIIDSVQLVTGIEIDGVTQVNENATINLAVKTVKDNGVKETITNVAPMSVTQVPNILTITKSGQNIVCKAPNNLTEDTPVTISVEHDIDGVTFRDDHVVTVKNTVRGVADWNVAGDDIVYVGRKHEDIYAYSLDVDYDDGTTSSDIRALEWRITDNPNVIISNQDTGRIDFTITESDVTGDQKFTIQARHTLTGTSIWKEKEVTIKQQPRDQIEFRIEGQDELNENVISNGYIGQAHFGNRWFDDCVLKSLVIVGESHGATIVQGNKIDTSRVTSARTLTVRGTFDWMEMVDNVATLEIALKNNDNTTIRSITFDADGEAPKVGEEINPTAVTVVMSNSQTSKVTAKSVTILEGAELVTVTGTGASTRFTVKDIDETGVVRWTGIADVQGLDETVAEGSITATKVIPFVMKMGFAMCEALQPELLEHSVEDLIPLMEADHYYFEITDEMGERAVVGAPGFQEINLDMGDAPDGTYPVYPEPAPYSTTHIIVKAKWGRPCFTNAISQEETIHGEGARSYRPRDALDTLPDTKPHPWVLPLEKKYEDHIASEIAAVRFPLGYIPYKDPNDGEVYIMVRAGMPAAPTQSGPPVFLRLRFVPWMSAFPLD